MTYILKGANVYNGMAFEKKDIVVKDGVIFSFDKSSVTDAQEFDFENKYIFPGFTDVHVHLREPGFDYKETIKTGTLAGAHGGYTNVFSMPNLNPVPDSLDNLKVQLDIIDKDAVINVYPYGSITKCEMGETLSDMDDMAPFVKGFSDDGRGVQSEEMMVDAMNKAKSLGLPIVAHCEDNSLLFGGYIHDGEYAKANGHKGICSESEWGPIKRDVGLIKKTGCKYHVCHISTKESVEIIRQAKKDGLDITCETGPHYLILNDMDIKEHGRFKMNPPIRSEEDRKALVEGIIDGTIDMIATDHAPHSEEEKTRGLEKSLMGVVGIEHAFSLMYTHMVKTGVITLEKLTELLTKNPCERFGLDCGIEISKKADLCVFDLDKEYEIRQEDMLSKGKFSPFIGDKVYGECLLTMCDGNIVYKKN